MRTASLSLRSSLSLIVALMGVIGLGLAIATGEIYRQLMLDHEREGLRKLAQLEAQSLLREHGEQVRLWGHRLQQERLASWVERYLIAQEQPARIQQALADTLALAHVSTPPLPLLELYLYNPSLHLITSSTQRTNIVCGKHIKNLREMPFSRWQDHHSHLCLHEQRLLSSSLILIGNPQTPLGYLQLVSDPLPALGAMSRNLGLPIRILRGEDIVQQSRGWRDNTGGHVWLSANITLSSDDGQTSPLRIAIKRDITGMQEELGRTRGYVMLASGLITVLAIGLFLFIINKTTLVPLSTLSRQLRKLRDDKSFLGEKIPLRGNIEIRELTRDFNAMTTELAGLYERMEDLAFRDELTALPNRSKLQDTLIYHTRQNQENGLPFALFMMDLDHFKTVNDTLGHHSGDLLLQQVSERLTGCLRKTDNLARLEDADKAVLYEDMVARLGGDEFAAVLPTVGRVEDAMIVANKIQQAMEQPFEIEGCNFSVGISIGIVLCPEHGTDCETLMRRADVAMYQAKNERMGAKLYDPRQDHHSVELLTLGDELKQALRRDDVVLYYQPKVDLRKQRLIGVEALLRWPHPERGFVSPERFIAIAEQTGLIHKLTAWVIDTGLRDLAHWLQTGYRFNMAINLSPKSLLNPEFIDQFKQALQQHHISPHLLTLEITETTIMSDPQRALEILRHLYNAGIAISIDDFGTGYSSLSYLKELPVDELKIDRSFVLDMLTESGNATLVRSIIDLAKNMGLQVTAEGVENQAILRQLQALECDRGQGYYIARPMPAGELTQWLRESDWKPASSIPPQDLSA